jgi:hypothetical protein
MVVEDQRMVESMRTRQTSIALLIRQNTYIRRSKAALSRFYAASDMHAAYAYAMHGKSCAPPTEQPHPCRSVSTLSIIGKASKALIVSLALHPPGYRGREFLWPGCVRYKHNEGIAQSIPVRSDADMKSNSTAWLLIGKVQASQGSKQVLWLVTSWRSRQQDD